MSLANTPMSIAQVAGCNPKLFAQFRRLEHLDVPREAEQEPAQLAGLRHGRLYQQPLLALAGHALVVREARVEEETAGIAVDAEAQMNRRGRQRHVQLPAAQKLREVEAKGDLARLFEKLCAADAGESEVNRRLSVPDGAHEVALRHAHHERQWVHDVLLGLLLGVLVARTEAPLLEESLVDH